jgi:acetylglutamate kinase
VNWEGRSVDKLASQTFVIKYGGSIIDDEAARDAFIEDIKFLTEKGIKFIIVHGGGPEISKWLKKTGTESRFVKGLRVTDSAVMEIVEMVLAGRVNKKLTHSMCMRGLNAVGVCGKDSNLIKAKKKYIYENGTETDIGFVGEVSEVNKSFLMKLLDNDLIPVIAPIGCDNEGNSYNINADYAAASISGALKADKLLIITDVDGVYKDIKDPSTLLPSITIREIKEYSDSGIIAGGMIPKLECCVSALEKGAKSVQLIDGRKTHCLLNSLQNNNGTKIITERV